MLVLQVVKGKGSPEQHAVPLTKRPPEEQWHTKFFAKLVADNGNRIDNLKEKVLQDKTFHKLKSKDKAILLLNEVHMCYQKIAKLRLLAAKQKKMLSEAYIEHKNSYIMLGRRVSEVSKVFIIT